MRHLTILAALALASTATPAIAQSITIAPPATWRSCAAEGAVCASRAGALVRYGAGSSFAHRVVNGSVRCDNATFGDPAPDTVKSCAIASPASAAAPPKPTPLPTPAPSPAAPPVPAPSDDPRAKLGVNAGGIDYFAAEQTFANQAMVLEWRDPAGGWAYTPKEDLRDGLPIAIKPGHSLRAFLTPPAGAWLGKAPETRCTWAGTGAVTVGGGGVTSTGPRSIVFNWPVTRAPIQTVTVSIDSTDAADPVRDIDCREPGDTGTYAAQLLDYLKPFGVVRFLDWSSANGNPPAVTWATRGRAGVNAVSGSDGVALEYQIGLANAANASPWFTVPLNADADYQRRMAQMVHDRIPAGRPVYVELSNETWNYQFGQARQLDTEGKAANLSDNGFMAGQFKYAQRVIDLMAVWSQVYADRPGDLVRVVSAQSGNPWVGEIILDWNGGAIRDSIDAIAIAPYFFADATTLTDDHEANMRLLEDASLREIAGPVVKYQGFAKRFGKQLIAYEGGQHQLDVANLARLEKMQRDPRMQGIYTRYLTGWRAAGGDLFTLYAATGQISRYGAWGLREYAGQPLSETPKLRGVLDYAADR